MYIALCVFSAPRHRRRFSFDLPVPFCVLPNCVGDPLSFLFLLSLPSFTTGGGIPSAHSLRDLAGARADPSARAERFLPRPFVRHPRRNVVRRGAGRPSAYQSPHGSNSFQLEPEAFIHVQQRNRLGPAAFGTRQRQRSRRDNAKSQERSNAAAAAAAVAPPDCARCGWRR